MIGGGGGLVVVVVTQLNSSDCTARACSNQVFHQGSVGKGPRYAVYDFEYSLASGEGSR